MNHLHYKPFRSRLREKMLKFYILYRHLLFSFERKKSYQIKKLEFAFFKNCIDREKVIDIFQSL